MLDVRVSYYYFWLCFNSFEGKVKPLAQREIPGSRHQAPCPAGERGQIISQSVSLPRPGAFAKEVAGDRLIAAIGFIASNHPKFLPVKREKHKREKRRNTWHTVLITAWFFLASPPQILCEGSFKTGTELTKNVWHCRDHPALANRELKVKESYYYHFTDHFFCGCNCIIFPFSMVVLQGTLGFVHNKLRPSGVVSLHTWLWPSKANTNVFFSFQYPLVLEQCCACNC